ncbi:hypothetical protein C8F04DRAFT_1295668, partial [Mycena alexandri]
LRWSLRRPTNAAQKLPDNWEGLCEKSFFRIAHSIKEHDIPACLVVNSDQTQVVYAPGTGLTWAERGAKQVSVVGVEEKRAFTLVVSVAADGSCVPWQVIYKGSSPRSRPDAWARGHKELTDLGFQFVSSGIDTYWANQATMKFLADNVIAPYFERKKKLLRLPPSQKSIRDIDVWRVHRSKEFNDWMYENHPTIIIDFVPGGCT